MMAAQVMRVSECWVSTTNPVESLGRLTVLMLGPGTASPRDFLGGVAVVQVIGGDHEMQRKPSRVDHQVPLAAELIFLPASYPRESLPTFSAALTLWEPMKVATALGPLPVWRRIRLDSWSRICPMIPAAAQRAMKPQTVRQGGKSAGKDRHVQRVSAT